LALLSLGKKEARYQIGSTVSILAASLTSVRGPHVPILKLAEVDEINPIFANRPCAWPWTSAGHVRTS